MSKIKMSEVKEAIASVAVKPAKAAHPMKIKEVVAFGGHANPVTKPVAEQSIYEHRTHMHPFADNSENIVSHTTSHKKSELVEAILPEAKKIYETSKDPNFKSGMFVKLFSTWGPAQHDVITSALRQLCKDGKFKEIPEKIGKRVTYTYELLDIPSSTPAAQVA